MADILRISGLPEFPRDPNFILRQTEFWQNINAEIISLSEIDAGYAKNIIAFLERRASLIQNREVFYLFRCAEHPLLGARGDMAMDAQEKEIDHVSYMPSREWLHTQPLLKALVEIRDAEQTPDSPNPFPKEEG